MKLFSEVAEHLRSMAAQIESAAARPLATGKDVSVAEAIVRIRAAAGENGMLEFQVWCSSGRAEWSIWDGYTHHKSPSLAGALSILEAARVMRADTVDDIDAALSDEEKLAAIDRVLQETQPA